MAAVKCILGLLLLLALSAWTEALVVKKDLSEDDSEEDEGDPSVTEQLEKVNRNLKLNRDGKKTHHRTRRNTQPCALPDCMWPKSSDGKVYVPYVIADDYSSQELDVIKRGINSFSYSTCIRFIPRTDQRDFLFIQSLTGCYSYVGHQGDEQTVSLSTQGCVYFGIVQHELLHALGFSHEQCRSDRDQHIRVLPENIITGQDYNFDKIDTLNQETPYDYGSVMHYGRLAFSKDNLNPTMVAVPDPKAVFGMARRMSRNDINRVNLLYCRN